MSQPDATTVKLELLRPHPKQSLLFSDLSDDQLRELAADMKAKGLQHPVEVLPDFTIIAGHQRYRGAKLLEWTEIDVIVREDLAELGDLAVETYLISDNLFRRQMGRLERARCTHRLMELAAGGSLKGMAKNKEIKTLQAMRQQIGRLLGIGEREVVRLTDVLHAPIEIQEAYDRAEIGIADVGRVVRSGPERVEAILADLRAGVGAKEAVSRHVSGVRRKPKTPASQGYSALLKAIESAIDELGAYPDHVEPPSMPAWKRLKALNKGIKLLERLRECEGHVHQRGRTAFAKLKSSVPAGK